MYTLLKSNITEDIPENVLVYFDVNMPMIWTDLKLLLGFLVYVAFLQEGSVFNIPFPISKYHSDYLALGAESK